MVTPKSRKISFVIACYNSENTLKTVVDEICFYLNKDGYSYEVILVNDGSQDGTMQVIQNLCKSYPKVRGVDLSRNFGQQNAMLAGFSFVTGDLIFYCDDDGQSPVDEYQKFIEKIDEGYDMVWANWTNKKRSLFNGIGANLNNRMLKFIFNKPLDLSFGNPWVAKKFVIEETIKFKNPRIYLGGVFLTITTNMANVDCEQRKRLSGESNYSLIKLIGVWLNGLTTFSVAPLRVASLVGVLTALTGFIYMIYLIIIKLTYEEVIMGYSSIMSVILFIGGMLMVMIGMVGEYIGRIYLNINNLPQFVVTQKINMEND